MPRRGENIYKRKDGRWEGRIKQPESPDGKRKYQSVYGKTYGEVKKKMDERKREICTTEGKCSMSLETAANIWYADKKAYWKESTYAAYRHIVEKHLLPCLGSLPLYKVDNRMMGKLVVRVQKHGNDKELSSAYLSYICNVVIRIMTHIRKKTGMNLDIPQNPVVVDKRPKVMLPGENDLSKLEEYLLKNIQNDTCLGILTALYTGMRIGEICALTWNDIELETGILHIRNNMQRVRDYDSPGSKTKLLFTSPKTACSIRDIPLPPRLLDVLRACRKEPSMPLISGAKGRWMEPRTLQYRFQRILENCGVAYFKFHTLRHAFATKCVEKGFDSKSLSEILGHSNIQITLNLYVHSTLQQKRRLMNLLGTYSD